MFFLAVDQVGVISWGIVESMYFHVQIVYVTAIASTCLVRDLPKYNWSVTSNANVWIASFMLIHSFQADIITISNPIF